MAADDYLADLVAGLPRLIRAGWRPCGFGPPDAPTAVALLRGAPHATDVLLIRPEGPVMAYRAPVTAGLDALRAELVCWAFSGTLGPIVTAVWQARTRYGTGRVMPLACRPPAAAPWAYPMSVPAPGPPPAPTSPLPSTVATPWGGPVSSVPLSGIDPWAAFPGLRRVNELTAVRGWLVQRLATDADRIEIRGLRVWPGGWADALLVRAVADARAVRRDRHGALMWERHGGVDAVLDGLAALPPPPPQESRLSPASSRSGTL